MVTGGAGADAGLGLTAAEGLLRAGARVAVWDVDSLAIGRAREELHQEGLEAYFQEVDVTNRDQVHQALEQLGRDLGPVDTLVNNAALKSRFVAGRERGLVPFWELDLDRYRRLWEVNVFGALIVAAQIAPAMLARGHGSIINVVTSTATQQSPRHIAYGPSKAMLEKLTLGMAAQLSALGRGVRANAILPGAAVQGRPRPNDSTRAGDLDPHRPRYDCLVPLILRLAGNEGRDVTGQVFTATEFTPPPESERLRRLENDR